MKMNDLDWKFFSYVNFGKTRSFIEATPFCKFDFCRFLNLAAFL